MPGPGGACNPFGLSLSKPRCQVHRPFDRLRASGVERACTRSYNPFGLSLSKPWCQVQRPFDKLRASGVGGRQT